MSYTKEFKEKFLKLLEGNSGNIKATISHADFVGLSRNTVYKWRDTEPWFADRLAEIKEGWIDNLETAAYSHAINGNPAILIFLLKTQARHRGYIERTENWISGPEGKSIEVDWTEVPLEERKQILGIIKGHVVSKTDHST